MDNGRVLVACEFSSTVLGAFRARGMNAREIPGFPGYAVTSDGTVWGRRTNSGMRAAFAPLKPSPDAKGYLGLTICNGRAKRRKVRIHRLVAELFHPNPGALPCVRHLDNNKSNNNKENLQWGTYAENEADKHAHGTWRTRFNGKMSQEDRSRARRLVAEGLTHTETGKLLGVSHATISRLIRGEIWKDDLCQS